MTGELPQTTNKRGGAGWWMDADGLWRQPSEWPGDHPPIEGWVRDGDARWRPGCEQISEDTDRQYVRATTGHTLDRSRPVPEPPRPNVGAARSAPELVDGKSTKKLKRATEVAKPPHRSRQGDADVRAMLIVGSAIGFAVVGLLVALVLQSRASAAEDAITVVAPPPEVIFAAETEEVRAERRAAAIAAAPEVARSELAALALSDPLGDQVENGALPAFDEAQWIVSSEGCLNPEEQVLVDRTTVPIVWADNLECVPSEGQWFDQYLGIEITRTIDADVQPLVPLEVVHASGGWQWTPATRAAFVTDIDYPATFAVLGLDSGHNPRAESPDVWRPSIETSWCGYAVDWIAIKTRWELSVTAAERDGLQEMLGTCFQPGSSGPHPDSVVIDQVENPEIQRLSVD